MGLMSCVGCVQEKSRHATSKKTPYLFPAKHVLEPACPIFEANDVLLMVSTLLS